jgi:GTP-binding protein EngB required for normal cell division
MKSIIKAKLGRGMARSVAFLLYIATVGIFGSCELAGIDLETKGPASYEEVVLFCGNPGVGKSTLCNSIFQKGVFESGANIGVGLTKAKQAHIYENRKYIDTPGLADIASMEQAAQEIEKALKENNNYKIIFVATLESARIKAEDIVSINKVCASIKADFEYGIIFNKVSNPVIKLLEEENQAKMKKYLATLCKQPASIIVLKKARTIADKNNMFFSADSENRKDVLDFIARLQANMIPAHQVRPIDVTDYKKESEKMEKELFDLRKEIDGNKREVKDIKKELKAANKQLEKYTAPQAQQTGVSGPTLNIDVNVRCLVM